MSVVLALFIALTAGASQEAQTSACAVHASKYPEILNDVAAKLKAAGAKEILSSYEDGSLEVALPRFSANRIGSYGRGERRVLKLPEVLPYETEDQRNRVGRAIAKALFQLEIYNSTPEEKRFLNTDMGIAYREFPVAPKPTSRRRLVINSVVGTTAIVAIAGTSVVFWSDITDGAQWVRNEIHRLNPFSSPPTAREENERRLRELEASIDVETNRLYGANQEKIDRERAELNELLQKHPELRRAPGR